MTRFKLVPRSFVPATILVLAAWLGGCEDIVYRDRPPFNPPPDATSGFLGYYTVDSRQTTCGNCHVGQQIDWVHTKHANAWDDLLASGESEAFCEGCHTVNARGNSATGEVGYDNVQDEAYHDVQCESCHGPGELHVENPTPTANKPFASINVYPAEPVADTAAVINGSCGACHQAAGPSQNHNYLKEWLTSGHGRLNGHPEEASCQPCHEAKGFLLHWGINTVYKELGTGVLMPQNCVVCHDPHGSAKDADGNPLEGQLRFTINSPVPEYNLCTKCHNRYPEATLQSVKRGPHGVQGPVLFGTAGYFPPGTEYDTTAILTTHGSTANPRLCAGCHVNRLTGLDAGGTPISYVGHTFDPLPCLMAPGIVDTTFTDECDYTVAARSWAACTASGCHGTQEVAAQRLFQILNEKEGYLRTLWIDVDGDARLDPFPADSGYLAKIKQQAPNELEYDILPYSNVITSAKGALFNAQMLGEALSGHPDGSHGVHNPFLTRTLLQASIADLLANYPAILPAPPPQIQSAIESALRSGALKMSADRERAVLNASAAR